VTGGKYTSFHPHGKTVHFTGDASQFGDSLWKAHCFFKNFYEFAVPADPGETKPVE